MRRKVILLTVTVVVIVGWFVATLVGGNRPALGLDLQGGTNIVLAPVKGSDLSTLGTAVAIIRSRANGCAGVSEPDVSRQGNNIQIDMPGAKNVEKCQKILSETAELQFRPVIGSFQITPNTSTTTAPAGSSTTVKGATTTTGPAVQGATSTTVKGKALGVPRAIDATLIAAHRPAAAPTTVAPTASTAKPTTASTVKAATGTTVKGSTPMTAAPAANTSKCPVTPPEKNVATAQVVLTDRKQTVCYELGPTVLSGKNVGSADKTVDNNGAWVVNVHFKTDDFVKKVAEPYVGKQVAIVLDQDVISAPTIQQGITGRDVQITGAFTEGEANNLALVLRYGSLPVQFTTLTSANVSPTLGKDQLRAGITAGVIGLILVALYMIFFYRLLGLVVWVGLGLTGMFLVSLVTWLSTHQGTTLTLAGVTGIIVSVGVTVDSYVVYFERLKDEVRTGKTVRSSVEPGFRRAFRTIIAADLVSLIGAVVLYWLAAGSVRGFAFFLGLSTLLDLVLAYCFMYPAVVLLGRRPGLVRMPGVGIAAGLDTVGVQA